MRNRERQTKPACHEQPLVSHKERETHQQTTHTHTVLLCTSTHPATVFSTHPAPYPALPNTSLRPPLPKCKSANRKCSSPPCPSFSALPLSPRPVSGYATLRPTRHTRSVRRPSTCKGVTRTGGGGKEGGTAAAHFCHTQLIFSSETTTVIDDCLCGLVRRGVIAGAHWARAAKRVGGTGGGERACGS